MSNLADYYDRNVFLSKPTEALIEQLFNLDVERYVLANGLTLVHLPDFSSEVVSVQVWVKTGSIHEGALIGSGLSHFLEHLLFKGTERRDYKSISRELHALGAEMNAYTSFDRTVYYANAPSAVFVPVVDLLSDLVLHSVLPADEVDCERDVILREIDMDLDDPDRRLGQALFRTAFQKHPYRDPVIGHRALFEQVSREELWAYYRSRYVPNNMVVSIVGAVNWENCLQAVEDTFGTVDRGRLAPALVAEEPVQLASRKEAIVDEYGVSRGVLGFKVPHLSHSDSPVLDALAYVMGVGESSLLWEQLRNQQRLVHYIDCRNWNSGDCGLFEVSYVSDHEKLSEVEPAIVALINDICTSGLEEDMVQKAYRQILKTAINRRKTMSGQASWFGFAETVVGDLDYGRRYFQQLQSIMAQDLQRVAERYLIKEQMSAATLGPQQTSDSTSATSATSSTQKLKPFELIEFDSGARLLVQPDRRLPKVHICCVMRGGPLYETVGQRGISELLAELLTKDTENRSAAEISALVDRIGGSFTADSGNNTISLALEVFSSDIDIAIELLSDALTSPSFADDTFRTELESQIAGLKEEDDEIFDYGFRKLRRHFFGDHPFAVSASGRVDDLEALVRDDLVAQFNRLVTAPNLVVSVVGDFETKALREQLQLLLESKVRSAPFAVDQTLIYKGPTSLIQTCETMDREQAVLFRAYPCEGICDNSYVVGELLNELFNGMSSRLFERVREDKGLAYYVGTTRTLGLRMGMFTFYAGTHPDQVSEVFSEIDSEIARVKTGKVTEEELQSCRTRLNAARLTEQQTIESRALHAALNVAYGLPIETAAEYARKLDKISLQSVTTFAKTFFNDQHSVQLVVRPG